MSALADSLRTLRDFLAARGVSLDKRDVRIVEIGPDVAVDERGRFHVRRAQLRTVADYEMRFKELMGTGLPWINVSCLGMADEHTLIAIEFPRRGAMPATRTSVNYSGPAAQVVKADLSVESLVVFE